MSLPISLDRFHAWTGFKQDGGDTLIVQCQIIDGEVEDIGLSTMLEPHQQIPSLGSLRGS